MLHLSSLFDGLSGIQYDPDVDHPIDTVWRVGTLDSATHDALAARLNGHKYVESVDCSNDLEPKARAGGLFGCWIIHLRKSPVMPLSAVAANFPCLRSAPSVLGSDGSLGQFDRWQVRRWADVQIEAGTMPEGARHAVLFILHLDDPSVTTFSGIGSFSLPDAMRVWDRPHLNAFLAWADGFREQVLYGKAYLEAITLLAKYQKGDERFIEALQRANWVQWQQGSGQHVDSGWAHVTREIAEGMTRARGLTDEQADWFRRTNGRQTSKMGHT